ncbi:DNA-binding response regulator [Bacillus cereus]|uniref:response regulator transcription factor n=1 Tax=Bacillus cereus TaxID=1396 RepID=UPI000BEC2235|nr:response regulator transcription factor [Bacillus cereus]MEB9942610.1 response regulator transcription factor [Bacillus cereus]PDZ59103.1 DNA-binding response regulator [Bacillus cereus]PEQ82788.1 DNA-binding response regulator [Bacillus cereus]PES12457.1 DNA-binding response regulator [Bacillus cereus]PEU12613.1 DNA-binding response regulator [Bacillus cereus]
MQHILIIEDEESLADFLELELKYEGYKVDIQLDGRKGLSAALEKNYDLILLDLMLPARDSIMDRVTGLDSGADDYLPKPFAIEELLARMRVIFRREEHIENKQVSFLTFKDLQLQIESRTITKGNEEIELTNKEFELLLMFMKNINRVLTRDVLLDQVWGYDAIVETNIVDVYVRYLRNKLHSVDKEEYIQTVRGAGYIMK